MDGRTNLFDGRAEKFYTDNFCWTGMDGRTYHSIQSESYTDRRLVNLH